MKLIIVAVAAFWALVAAVILAAFRVAPAPAAAITLVTFAGVVIGTVTMFALARAAGRDNEEDYTEETTK